MKIEFDGKIFHIDFKKVMELISDIPQNERNIETTIDQQYIPSFEDEDEQSGDKLCLGGKTVSEHKETINENAVGIRYSFLKSLIEMMTVSTYDGNGDISEPKAFKDFTFRQVLAFNTLVELDILVEDEQ